MKCELQDTNTLILSDIPGITSRYKIKVNLVAARACDVNEKLLRDAIPFIVTALNTVNPSDVEPAIECQYCRAPYRESQSHSEHAGVFCTSACEVAYVELLGHLPLDSRVPYGSRPRILCQQCRKEYHKSLTTSENPGQFCSQECGVAYFDRHGRWPHVQNEIPLGKPEMCILGQESPGHELYRVTVYYTGEQGELRNLGTVDLVGTAADIRKKALDALWDDRLDGPATFSITRVETDGIETLVPIITADRKHSSTVTKPSETAVPPTKPVLNPVATGMTLEELQEIFAIANLPVHYPESVANYLEFNADGTPVATYFAVCNNVAQPTHSFVGAVLGAFTYWNEHGLSSRVDGVLNGVRRTLVKVPEIFENRR